MKVFPGLLLTVSLTCGTLAASTAYLVSLDSPDASLVGLTLNAPAGVVAGKIRLAVAEKGARLTRRLLARLRNSDPPVRNVTVQEFSANRWRGKWAFAGSLFGLGLAAVLINLGERRSLKQADVAEGQSPQETLSQVVAAVDRLRSGLAAMPDRTSRLSAITAQIEELQRSHLAAFVDARPRLIARLGLGRFANVMDHFARAERQINRAWSAAVDSYFEEAVSCLDEASSRFQATLDVLRG